MSKTFSQMLTIVERDLRIEARSQASFISAFLFVILTLSIFQFSFSSEESVPSDRFVAGVIWIVISFSGTLLISNLSQRDQEDRVLEGLLLSGMPPMAIFGAKFLSALFLMLFLEILLTPLFMLFFRIEPGAWLFLYSSVMILGSVGYCAVGTLFSNLLARERLKNLLFPILFYPVMIPMMILATHATSSILQGDTPVELRVLAGFDLIFVTASALLFEFFMETPS